MTTVSSPSIAPSRSTETGPQTSASQRTQRIVQTRVDSIGSSCPSSARWAEDWDVVAEAARDRRDQSLLMMLGGGVKSLPPGPIERTCQIIAARREVIRRHFGLNDSGLQRVVAKTRCTRCRHALTRSCGKQRVLDGRDEPLPLHVKVPLIPQAASASDPDVDNGQVDGPQVPDDCD